MGGRAWILMAIVAGMVDIFFSSLGITTEEMTILEAYLLETVDLALTAGQTAFALETMDALIDLHTLKRRQVEASVLEFWEGQFPGRGLTFARGARPAPALPLSEGWKTLSRKHNTKHPERSRSHYPDRLTARGVSSASVRMESLPVLRKRQLQRISLTGVPWATTRSDDELMAA